MPPCTSTDAVRSMPSQSGVSVRAISSSRYMWTQWYKTERRILIAGMFPPFPLFENAREMGKRVASRQSGNISQSCLLC